MIVFSLVSPTSFQNVKEKWVPEIRNFDKNASIILVGNKLDLREDKESIEKLVNYKSAPISFELGSKLAQDIDAFKYIECSAKTQENLKQVFDSVIEYSLSHSPKKKSECLIF